MILFRDYETRGSANLKKVGAWRYAAHPNTQVLCCAYAVDDGPVMIWMPGDAVPPEFTEAASNPDWVVSAFNDNFERLIELHVMAPRHGWPLIPIERHRCTQAAASALALPASLGKVAAALELEQQKDSAGRKLMLQMARHRKDETLLEAHDLARLAAYCKQDVVTERAVYKRVGHLSDAEQKLWVLDATINDRGVPVDRKLIDAAIKIGNQAKVALDTELSAVTGGAITSVGQVAKMQQWLADNGCPVKDTQKGTLKQALRRKAISAECRRVIELRLDGAHAAAKKYESLRNWAGDDDRIRGALKFHGASTGRWTSFGVQLHNLKHETKEDLASALEAIYPGDFALLRERYAQPLSLLGDVARAAIAAAPGHRFICADFSGVESRLTAWLAGEQSKLDQWAKFDATGNPEDEPYYALGLSLGFPADTARAMGKIADLAFGFGGSVGAYRRLAPNSEATDEEILRQRNAWQQAHMNVVKLWYRLMSEAVQAITNPGTVRTVNDKLSWRYDGTFLFLRLHNGRELAYPFAELKDDSRGRTVISYMDTEKGGWAPCRHGQGAWHGTWIENAVQAVARDLFAAAMPRLEKAGYPIVLHIHDEVVAEVAEGVGSKEEFLQILTAAPDWAEGLPIAAKVRNGPRFAKSSKPVEVSETGTAEIEAEDDVAEDDVANDEPYHNGRDEDRSDDSYASGERQWGCDLSGYIYRDEKGENYLRVTRTSAKQFPQARWENGRWVTGKPKGPKIPYRLPELIAAAPDVPVFIAEGEKDAESVAALGFIATTNSEGAGPGKWTSDLNRWFVGRQTAYILEDNDTSGRSHAREVGRNLQGVVADIRVLSFPELPAHGDVTDWLELGHTRDELLARATLAPKYEPDALTSVRASSIEMTALEWFWNERFAIGKLGIIAGLPDEGKGQILSYIAAQATNGGAWPLGEGQAPQGNVLVFSDEDDPSDTLVPRFAAAGANLDRVEIMKMVRGDEKDRLFSLVSDLELLRKKIVAIGDVVLVLIDPISAYLGVGKIDSFRTADVRGVLTPLVQLAGDLRVAVVAVMHFNKKLDVTNALVRISDSLAFGAVARHVYGVIDDAENGRKLFVRVKNNVAKIKNNNLAFHFSERSVGVDQKTQKAIVAPYIIWGPQYVDVTATEAMQASTDNKSPTARDGAKRFLQAMLNNGPVLKTEIEEAAEANGISTKTLYRAKDMLKVEAKKDRTKPSGKWTWELPTQYPDVPF